MDGYGYGPGHVTGWGWFGMGLMFLLLVALIGLVAWLVARSAGSTAPRSDYQPPREPSARDVLDQRLARGEIEPDDYHARIDALAGRRPLAA